MNIYDIEGKIAYAVFSFFGFFKTWVVQMFIEIFCSLLSMEIQLFIEIFWAYVKCRNPSIYKKFCTYIKHRTPSFYGNFLMLKNYE